MTEDIKAQAKAKPAPEDIVICKVLKDGDGRVSTGEWNENGNTFYAKGETFPCVRSTAELLEERHFVTFE